MIIISVENSIFVETAKPLMDRKSKRTAFILNKIFCDIINVTFDKFDAYLCLFLCNWLNMLRV